MLEKIANKITEKYIRSSCRQGRQFVGIERIYRMVWDACREEFTEDNDISLRAFLVDRFDAACPTEKP